MLDIYLIIFYRFTHYDFITTFLKEAEMNKGDLIAAVAKVVSTKKEARRRWIAYLRPLPRH